MNVTTKLACLAVFAGAALTSAPAMAQTTPADSTRTTVDVDDDRDMGWVGLLGLIGLAGLLRRPNHTHANNVDPRTNPVR